ncbi:MAG: hypothetical protein J7463_00105 [Roseiflexus sp.]|nr:hypothetical protein [Roseiflexus sp.]
MIGVGVYQGDTHRSVPTSQAPEESLASGRAENGTRRRYVDRPQQRRQYRAPDRTALHPVPGLCPRIQQLPPPLANIRAFVVGRQAGTTPPRYPTACGSVYNGPVSAAIANALDTALR